MRLSSDSWWLAGSALLAIGAAPWLVRGDAIVNSRRAEARQELASMSPAERQRVEENYDRYRQLAPEARQRWRQLHTEIEDDAQHGGSAARALEIYADWIPTLPPFRLDELRQRTNPQERVALMMEIDDESRTASSGFGNRFGAQRFWSPLRTGEFWEALDYLESSWRHRLAVDEQNKIDALPAHSVARSVALFTALQSKQETFQSMISDATANELIKILADRVGLFRESRTKSGNDDRTPDGRDFERRKFLLRTQMYWKLLGLIIEDGMKNPPTDEDLVRQLDSVSEVDRERYYSTSADRLKQWLRYDYFQQQRGQQFAVIREFFEMEDMSGPFGRPGANPDRGRPRGEGDRETGPGRQFGRRPDAFDNRRPPMPDEPPPGGPPPAPAEEHG